MTKFRLVLVLLCLGLLGALPFVISSPKPDAADQQEAAIQPQTAVQRQMAAQRATAQAGLNAMGAQQTAQADTVRAQIGVALVQARDLAQSGATTKALAIVDGLQQIPDQSAYEASVISQMREYVMAKAAGR